MAVQVFLENLETSVKSTPSHKSLSIDYPSNHLCGNSANEAMKALMQPSACKNDLPVCTIQVNTVAYE